MKKILKTLMVTLMISIMSSTAVLADSVKSAEEIRQMLLGLGIPSTYVGNAIEYLQKTEISEAQYEVIKAKINEAEKILNGDTDISLIDSERKAVLQNLATEAASSVGLKVVFGKDSTGVTTVVLSDANNNIIVAIDTIQVIEIVQNLDLEEVHEMTKDLIEFANNSEKDEFEPVDGDFNYTGTNAGSEVLIGSGLIILSGVTFVTTRKVFA